MPLHALAAHLVAALAPLAGLMCLGYALAPAARRGTRLPTLLATLAAVVAGGVTLTASGSLYAQAKATLPDYASTALPHAKAGDGLAVALFVLLVVLLAVVWRPLAPERPRTTGGTIAAAVLALAALATLWFTWTTIGSGVASVWAHHVSWKA